MPRPSLPRPAWSIASRPAWAMALFAVFVSLSATRPRAEDYAAMLPRNPPTPPSQTSADFSVAEGYRIQMIASEPLVNSPVEIQWAADGALFVCEMRGYSEDRDDHLSRVSRLIDEDQDGIYDKSTVYCDGLFWPTAIFPYEGGLLVADAPDVIYFKDTDADGIADERKTVLTGFSLSNVQGLVNSFRWGLDNRIHLAVGTAGGKIRRPDQDESQAVAVRGFDLALDPKTLHFEKTSGGGQHGMCFDDWGRKYVCSNSDHLQQVLYESRYIKRNPLLVPAPARRSIADDGPQAEVYRISETEPWRLIRTRLRVAGVVGGPIEGGGRAAGYFTGATGVTIYRGDAWTRETDDRNAIAIIGDVGGNLIHRKLVTGPTFNRVGTRIDPNRELVASKDNWFRPAQFACGPDGALSVVDVYREVIEHPKSLPPAIKQHLDLTAGRSRGRLYRIIPLDFQQRETPDLTSSSTAELIPLLAHPNAWHRETAARLIFEREDPTVIDALNAMACEHKSPLGRLHALYALQGQRALSPDLILQRLGESHPQVLVHVIRLAESFSDQTELREKLASLTSHRSPDVRYQLAWSLGEFAGRPIAKPLAEILLRDPDNRWLRTAVFSSAEKERVSLFLSLLEADDSLRNIAALQELATQIARRGDPPEKAKALDGLLGQSDHPSALPLLRTLGGGRILKSSAERPSEFQRRIDELSHRALQLAKDRSASMRDRIAALSWLSGFIDDRSAESLLSLTRPDEPGEVTVAAIKAITPFGSAEVLDRFAEDWPRWSPKIRIAAADALFATPDRVSQLLEAIDEGKFVAEDFPRNRWQSLTVSRDPKIRDRAEAILAATAAPSREGLIREYLSSMPAKGNPTRGREVFVKHCAACHRSGDVGQTLGPSLASAATRGRDSITANVLDPNQEVNPQYVNFVVLKTDGRTTNGMIVEENANSLTLQRGEGVREVVLRSDLELLRSSGKSLMPEGLEKSITPAEMADLTEYLLSAHKLDAKE